MIQTVVSTLPARDSHPQPAVANKPAPLMLKSGECNALSQRRPASPSRPHGIEHYFKKIESREEWAEFSRQQDESNREEREERQRKAQISEVAAKIAKRAADTERQRTHRARKKLAEIASGERSTDGTKKVSFK